MEKSYIEIDGVIAKEKKHIFEEDEKIKALS